MKPIFDVFEIPNIYRSEDQENLKKEDSVNEVKLNEFDPEKAEGKEKI